MAAFVALWPHEGQKVYFVVAGDLVYTYLSLGYRNPVTDVAFHPFDNMVAFCSYGESHLIKIFTYDYKGNFDELSALEVALVVDCWMMTLQSFLLINYIFAKFVFITEDPWNLCLSVCRIHPDD